MRQGIAIAGLMMVDEIKYIGEYPLLGSAAEIGEIVKILDGGLCNSAISLARLDGELPITPIGVAGEDEFGEITLFEFSKYPGIEIYGLRRQGSHGFSDIMAQGKRHAAFRYFGANALLGAYDFNLEQSTGKMFFISDFFGLKAAMGEGGGDSLLHALMRAREQGIETALSMGGEPELCVRNTPGQLLALCDCCIVGGRDARISGGRARAREICGQMIDAGVGQWAVVRMHEGAVATHADGTFAEVPAPALPEEYVKGTIGSFDAFCAGVLYAAHSGKSLDEALRLGLGTETCALGMGCCSGVRPVAEALNLYETMPKTW